MKLICQRSFNSFCPCFWWPFSSIVESKLVVFYIQVGSRPILYLNLLDFCLYLSYSCFSLSFTLWLHSQTKIRNSLIYHGCHCYLFFYMFELFFFVLIILWKERRKEKGKKKEIKKQKEILNTEEFHHKWESGTGGADFLMRKTIQRKKT